MEKEELIKQMQEKAERAKKFRKERQSTTDPNVFLHSPTLPTKLKMRQFIRRATHKNKNEIKELWNDLQSKKKEMETLGVGGKQGEPGYVYYRNLKALLDFIKGEYQNTLSEHDDFFTVEIEHATEKDYEAFKGKKKKLKEEIAVLQKRYDKEIQKALNIDNPRKRVKKLQLGLTLLNGDRMAGKVEPSWADRKLRLLNRKIDKAEDEIYNSEKKLSLDKKSDTQAHTKRGNPDFKKSKIKMPNGFYEDADKLKEENQERSQSWIEDKLIRKYFDGDKGKKSTVYRRLKEHWGN